jgi:hypothetical protein
MIFSCIDHTPNGNLSATRQTTRELGDSQNFLDSRNPSKELTIWESPRTPAPSAKLFRHKPQISSIPGISPKEPHRYRVMIGSQALGDRAIKQHFNLGKYFPTSQLQVIKEDAALIARIVKSIFRKNPNHLCSACGSSERKLDEAIALASQSTHL